MQRGESIDIREDILAGLAPAQHHAPHPRGHLYRLKFQEENGRPAKDVEFEAEDSYQALVIAHQEARTRSAELWRDGQKLCSIRRTEREVWEIWPAT